MSEKKKILIHSNHCRVKTGFGKHIKHLLTFLYKTGKYEIVEFANGRQWEDPSLKTLPWKCIGSLPSDPNLVNEIKSDQKKLREANYGWYKIDDVIAQEKPDIYLGIEDIWGLEAFLAKKWWNKINSLIWTPIDSLPILDKHLIASQKTKNIIVQASFAQKALQEKGFNNNHLLPVPIDVENFYKLSDDKKLDLRKHHNLDQDSFIIGFVFRNQLRKGVPNILEGFKQFLDKNPESKAKLLLHTHWKEGWDINKLIAEKSIDPNLILTTYYCDKCGQYEIKPFSGQDIDCRFCGSKKSQQTAQIQRGVSEVQLNEIYNLMDLYCHPFTSGGQEIPIQEAKLTELITLVTNYSCGEDYCSKNSGGLPLSWSEYREPGTQFIKASTHADSIAMQIEEVYNMTPKKRSSMGKKARDFVVDFCSIDNVCSKFESIISKMEKPKWDYDMSYVPKNANHQIPNVESNEDFILDLFKNMLNFESKEEDINGYHYWLKFLNEGGDRNAMHQHFVKLALDENKKQIKVPFDSLLTKDDEGKRILFCLPENEIDVVNSTSLLKFIKDQYPDFNIYYATKKEYFNLILTNPYVHQVIEYNPVMEDSSWGEGKLGHKGYFNFVLLPHTNTNKVSNFMHAGQHKIPYNLNYA